MRIEKYQIYSYLRITFCISVIAIWSAWLLKTPEQKIENRKKRVAIRNQKSVISNQKTEGSNQSPANSQQSILNSQFSIVNSKSPISNPQSSILNPQPSIFSSSAHQETEKQETKKKKEEQPPAINTQPIAANAQSLNQLKVNSQKLTVPKPKPPILNSKTFPLPIAKSQKPIAVDAKPNKLNLDIKLPNTASATRKILLATKPSKSTNSNEQSQVNTSLRKQVHTEKNSLKARDIIEDLNSDISWVPKYIAEDTELKQNKIVLSNNLDLIVSQLEVTEITNNPPNNIHAIKIKNSITNKIEILKLGDQYEGLKLLEINQDNIVLGNENLNKTYTKKLNKD